MYKILVVGESCLDVFTYGDVERLSPEAPVPVFKPKNDISNQGMAGNVVKNLEKISTGSEITFWTQKEKITKQRMVDKKTNHMLIRVDTGENSKLSKLVLDQELKKTIFEFDVVIISDYNKGFISEETFVEIGTLSKLLFVDSKRMLTQKMIDVSTYIKLNQQEYHNNKEIVHRNLEKFVITLGAEGAQYLGTKYPSPKPQETIDVSGAGDTFIASLTIKYLETNKITEAIEFANKMSSIVVSKRGVVTP
jgi:D-beta-D-heptose 7-phosphate kinase/D-beta-D-heptose 1-phosphate adenosyltransferase